MGVHHDREQPVPVEIAVCGRRETTIRAQTRCTGRRGNGRIVIEEDVALGRKTDGGEGRIDRARVGAFAIGSHWLTAGFGGIAWMSR